MKKKRSDTSRYLFTGGFCLMVVLISGCGGGDEDNDSLTSDNGEEAGQSNDYHLIRAEYDSDGDGSIEYVETFTSDANGNLTRWESYGEDGQIQHVATFSYDSHGNLTKKEWDSAAEYLEPPKLVDGIIDSETHFINTYDENDNLV
ncbi:MAG TPA: hypothetical protein DCM38_04030, partial [Gammaproteobacteria bacterium]|nr:hypothetical protein [Gammaproteobacteria bacterium]